ncbi:MAG: cardiolipin synthase [Candidatus Cryptobacteroides sp.]
MSTVLSILYIILIATIFYVILKERREPTETLAWILITLLVPIVGVIAYFLFGRSYRKSKQFSYDDDTMNNQIMKLCEMQLSEMEKEEYSELKHKNFVTLMLNSGMAALSIRNRLKILNNGYECFPALFTDLQKAQDFIHIEIFGIESGELFEKLLSILSERVQAGVEVRVIFDCVGSRALKSRDVKRMHKAGIKAYSYMPIWMPVFANKFNYRNHRKIIVIDGKVGYTGGMNIADRYLKGTKRGIWRDTQIRLEGTSVSLLNSVFVNDWSFVSNGELLYDDKYYPSVNLENVLPMQIAISGPDSPHASIMQAYFAAIGNAKNYIYISTPYLLPNQAIVTALQVAALSGVDVRILIPVRGDNILVAWAGYSYIDSLLDAGVSVYLYRKGFNHSKFFVIDDEMCSIGSANLDYRSFDTDFEVQAMIYDKDTSLELKSYFLKDLEDSELITSENWEKRPRSSKIMEPIARLFGFLF